MSRLLIIEDNLSLAKSLHDFFTREGFEVTVVYKLSEAQKLPMTFSLILLDWMLPDGQGIDFLRDLRKKSNWTPVIFLTAKSDLVDKVWGLESGANDYVVKPFEPRELLARIRGQLRSTGSEVDTFSCADLIVHLKSREVVYKGTKIVTTKKEFDLLALFIRNPNQVFSRDELLNKVWGFENFPTTRTVDTHVLQLRQKLNDKIIETIRGIGYRLSIDR